jgi:hypothetical protein
MTATAERPELTREQITAQYRLNFPLFAAYLDVVHEHQGPRASINEPSTGGIEQRAAVRLALARIGRPARDEDDVRHALAWIESIEYERECMAPPVDKAIRHYVIEALFPPAGCVPSAEDWLSVDDDDEHDADIDAILLRIPTDDLRRLLRETIEYAMPSILRHISAEDDDNRRRATVRGVS